MKKQEVLGDDDRTLIDKIGSGKDEAGSIVDKIAVKQLIENLDKREKELILLRFFKDKTQAEVARVLGITQVQVSRIEKKVLSSMRLKLTS